MGTERMISNRLSKSTTYFKWLKELGAGHPIARLMSFVPIDLFYLFPKSAAPLVFHTFFAILEFFMNFRKFFMNSQIFQKFSWILNEFFVNSQWIFGNSFRPSVNLTIFLNFRRFLMNFCGFFMNLREIFVDFSRIFVYFRGFFVNAHEFPENSSKKRSAITQDETATIRFALNFVFI